MKVTLLAVGSLKEDYFRRAAEEYVSRLTPYAEVKIHEIAEYKTTPSSSAANVAQARDKEGAAIIKAIPAGSVPVALAIEATPQSSVQFAAFLGQLRDSGQGHVCFIIGGSNGLSDAVKKASADKLSFGPLTLPHQLARIVLLEQIYRAFKIMRNEPYHK